MRRGAASQQSCAPTASVASKTSGHVFVRRRYPWGEWTNGDQWKIVQDEDYWISTLNMQISLHGRARKQGLKVNSKSFKRQTVDGIQEGLIFQFHEEDN